MECPDPRRPDCFEGQRLMAKQVLLVENDDITRDGMASVLRDAGYGVTATANGWQALEHLRRNAAPDLIVLDMLLPAYDGWRFLADRRRDSALASIPVVIATALGVASDEWAVSLGACGCLRKPFDIESLVQEVRRRIG
jgi:CheY-like chemotaxis protein